MKEFLPQDQFDLRLVADQAFVTGIVETMSSDDMDTADGIDTPAYPQTADEIIQVQASSAPYISPKGLLNHIQRLEGPEVSPIEPVELIARPTSETRSDAQELVAMPPDFRPISELKSVTHASWSIAGYRQPTAFETVTSKLLESNDGESAGYIFQLLAACVAASLMAPTHRIDKRYPSVAPINTNEHREPLIQYIHALLTERVPKPVREAAIGQDVARIILREAHAAIEQVDKDRSVTTRLSNLSARLMPNRATYRDNLEVFRAVEAAGASVLDSIIAFSDKHPAYTALEVAKIIGLQSSYYRPDTESVIASSDELVGRIEDLQQSPTGGIKVHAVNLSEQGDMTVVIDDGRGCMYVTHALLGVERLGADTKNIAQITAVGIWSSALKLVNGS